MRKFEQVFKPPFRVDRCIHWVYDSNNKFCFQFQFDATDEQCAQFEQVINKEVKRTTPGYFTHEQGMIYYQVPDVEGRKAAILIRGWGYLTGCGGLNLPEKEAAAIQDDLAEYIVETLNNKDGI